ncbi:hypothetical protein BH10PAT2_BH10PAT2_2220 [soil metagenome]
MKKLIGAVYFILVCVYSVFSYSLTDPNLVLTTWQPYWQFQQLMWHTFFNNSALLSETYIILITLLFACYFFLFFKRSVVLPHKKWLFIFIFILPLLFSYNALSHDVFNYIFNAKMVLIYHANPHVQIALDFPHDDWIRFMHNTNTPAPYGYLWTAISLIPFALGFGKFIITWSLFRIFSVLSVVLLAFSYKSLAQSEQHKKESLWQSFLLVFLNPLFLIEVISNSHNDLWMMAPALLSLAILHQTKTVNLKRVLFSLILLSFSVSIKLSTLVLIPIWGAIFIEQVLSQYQLPKLIRQFTSFIHLHYADMAVLFLFVPLLTPRSQQFNPWYLVWLLVWLPFLRWSWLKDALLVLSVSSLFRYVPWLLAGGYSDEIIFHQKIITFAPLIIYLLAIASKQLLTRNSTSSRVE